MRRIHSRLRLRHLVAASTIAVAAVGAQPGASAGAAPGPTEQLGVNVIRGISSLPSEGALPGDTRLQLGVSLRHSDPAGEQAFGQAVYDSSSPLFHHFLTPAQFEQRFGVDQQRLGAAVAWFAAGGLHVTGVPGTTDYFLATGSAAQVESLLHTHIARFSQHGLHFYANTDAPAVPASLRVNYIAGLNNLEGPRLANLHANTLPNNGLITPAELDSVYNLPSTDQGEGQSMAIFGWGVTDGVATDLQNFENQFGFPGMPLHIQYYGDPSIVINDTTGATEWRIDTQASTGMAPNADSETLYFGRDGSDASILAAYSAWVNDASGPLQGSSSFGGCEYSPQLPASQQDTVFQPQGEVILAQAVAEGRTMFASTGDTGASCPLVNVDLNGVGTFAVPLLNWPGASPSAVGVGGTVLYTDGNTPAARLQETSWTHTGGGSSPYIKAPAYQLGTTGLIGVCTTDESGNPYPPGTLCRGVPDVSTISGDVPGNGYPIVVSGQRNQHGAGTSLSSPLWLGMWTRLQAAAPTTAGKGFANPIFYAQGKNATSYANDFYDIGGATDGHTAPTCNLSPEYCSHIGWDYTSGWGVPHLSALITDVDGTTTPLCTTNHNCPALNPVPTTGGGTGPNLNPCAPLFTEAANETDTYQVEGQNLGVTTFPTQLDLVNGSMSLSADGTTLQVKLSLVNLNTTLPTGSGENDYRVIWHNGSTIYFALAAVQPGGTVLYTDGQAFVTPATTRYQPTHVDTGSFGSGPGGVVEIDVPLANVGSKAADVLTGISAETDVRSGTATTGLLQVEDTATQPVYDYQIGQTCPAVPEAPATALLAVAGGGSVMLAMLMLTVRRRRRGSAAAF